MNTAIIAAAGIGKRFGANQPKQFIEIHGKPIIVHTLEKFAECSEIHNIILVLPTALTNNFTPELAKYNFSKKITTVSGGRTRAASVAIGFSAIESDSAEIVAVHDGARPLVSVEEIARTIEKARKTGAACLVGKVTDTIKRIENGIISETVNRETLRRALTPQCFRYDILKRALIENDDAENFTDECSMVEKLGVEISIIEGEARNIKITTPDDLALAEKFLK